MDITLFEFDIEDASFAAHAPFSGSRSADEPEETGSAVSGGGKRVFAGLALAGLLGLAVWLRRNGAPAEVSLPDAEEVPISR